MRTSCLPRLRGLSSTFAYCFAFPTPIILPTLLRVSWGQALEESEGEEALTAVDGDRRRRRRTDEARRGQGARGQIGDGERVCRG